MQDAFGGILNLVFIVLFLVIVSGVLGFTVSYTKAFKMKNFVLSSIEDFEGRENCFSKSGNSSSSCSSIILEKAKSIGYSPVMKSCPNGYSLASDGLFCFCPLRKTDSGVEECDTANLYKRDKYRIITQVDINIPIIKNILSLPFFQVTGDTKYIK